MRWSTAKKVLYLGLNRRGQPRRVQAKGHNLGRLSAYARVLTQVPPPDRVEALQARMFGANHNLRHHHNSHYHRNIQHGTCPTLPSQEKDGRDKFRCRKRKKRKKRKRHCNEGEKPGPYCETIGEHRGANAESSGEGPLQSKRSCEGAASEELCRKQALDAPAKKRKSRIEPAKSNTGEKQLEKKNQQRKEVNTKVGAGGARKLNSNSTVEDPKVNGPNEKRKRPLGKQRMMAAAKKRMSGRATRTTVTAQPTAVGITLPSSWYPGEFTTPSTDELTRRRTKGSASPRNTVTSFGSKSSDVQTSRIGKALDDTDVVESTTVEVTTEVAAEEQQGYASLHDSSAEMSEEATSDELTQEDDSTMISAEYSTIMTTMDTTPPERTEDYTRATTQSILAVDSTRAKLRRRPFGREIRLPLGRLAMWKLLGTSHNCCCKLLYILICN